MQQTRSGFVVAAVQAALDGAAAPPVAEPPQQETGPRAAPPVLNDKCPEGFKPRPGNSQRCFNCGRHAAFHR
jgi:hypothetical protein